MRSVQFETNAASASSPIKMKIQPQLSLHYGSGSIKMGNRKMSSLSPMTYQIANHVKIVNQMKMKTIQPLTQKTKVGCHKDPQSGLW